MCLYVYYRERVAVIQRGESEGGRNVVRQGNNEERKETTPGIAVQCENEKHLKVHNFAHI